MRRELHVRVTFEPKRLSKQVQDRAFDLVVPRAEREVLRNAVEEPRAPKADGARRSKEGKAV